MGLLKFSLLLFIFSCSKITYVTKQGYGQLALELKGRSNIDVLKDPDVSLEDKEKIKKIIKYKNYFYKYFNKEQSEIYSETTFLDRDAVTYLVIASKFNEIKPLVHSFPFAGDFPYLGFYSLDDAKEYRDELKAKEYYTYLRPVQAYSTLDKLFFKDNILSSFFFYKDFDLAELIFHELTHTILFVEDNVAFNESFADYVAEKMVVEYFKLSEKDYRKRIKKKKKMKLIAKEITSLAKRYKKILEANRPKNKAESDQRLKNFISNVFEKNIRDKCIDLKITQCWPLKRKWNNASFTAFLTYNSKKNIIKEIQKSKKLNLKELLKYIERMKEKFEKSSNKNFSKFLMSSISH